MAAIGWKLTDGYNKSQIQIARDNNAHEIEIARSNAALSYMSVLQEIPNEHVPARQQALAIAAPVLPPTIAFQQAVQQLPDNTSALDILMSKYKEGADHYLVPVLEVPFHHLSRSTTRIARAPLNGDRESEAIWLLAYLQNRGYAKRLFDYLTMEYDNFYHRPVALLLYYDNYAAFLRSRSGEASREPNLNLRMRQELEVLLSNPEFPVEVKRAISFAAGVVFGKAYGSNDFFTRHTAQYFWHGIDVALGETPHSQSIDGYVYSDVIHGIELTSQSLRKAITELRPRELDADNIRLILYAYAVSSGIDRWAAPFLTPADAVSVVRFSLDWANTSRKRLELSMILGSLSGHTLFHNLLPDCISCPPNMSDDDIKERCESARQYSEMMIDWYKSHHADEWGIPKFFHDVVRAFPDLADEMDHEAWGVGRLGKSGDESACLS